MTATLKNFVKETLEQISEAVTEFSANANGLDGPSAMPAMTGYSSGAATEATQNHGLVTLGWSDDQTRDGDTLTRYATMVDFDVAVTAEDAEAASGGASIKVVQMFSAGGELSSESRNSSISRIRFKLPLQLR